MNEKYLKRLHAYLGVQDDYATWLEDTMSSEANVKDVYNSLPGLEHDYDTWLSKSFGEVAPQKKKETPIVSEPVDGRSPAQKLFPNNEAWQSFVAREKAVYEQRANINKQTSQYDYESYDFGDIDVDEIAANAQAMVESNIGSVYDGIDSDEEYLADQKRIVALSPGQMRTQRSATIGQPSYMPSQDYEVEVTEEYIEGEKDKSIKKAYSNQFDKLVKGDVREMVVNSLPEDRRGDKELVSALTDKLFFENNLAVDLDGDGRYNNQTLAEDALRGIYMTSADIGSSLLYGLASPFVDGEERKELRDEKKSFSENAAKKLTSYEGGISSSVANGDMYNAFRQTTTGLAQTAPIIGITLASGGAGAPLAGAGVVGLSGGIGAYMEVADDETFENDAYKYGYALANGVGDFAFGAIGAGIVGASSKAAQAGYLASRQAAKGAGKRITADMVKGYARRKGIAVGSEAAEEAATEITSYLIETKGRGQQVDMAQLFERGLDAAIVGGAAGGVFDSAGSMNGKVIAASHARADAQMAKISEAIKRKEQLEKELEEAKKPGSKEGIKRELNRLNAEIDGAAKQAAPFYEMMAVRHPEEFKAMQVIDVEVEQLRSQLKLPSLSDDARKVIEQRLEDKVADRVKIQVSFADESLSLDYGERTAATDMRTRDAVKDLDNEIKLAERAVDDVTDYGNTIINGVDAKALEIAQKRVEELKRRRSSITKLMGRLQVARNEASDAIGRASTEAVDMDGLDAAIKNVSAIEEALAVSVGVEPAKFVTGTADQLLSLNREVQDRATPEWVSSAVESMDNSSLTQEGIQEIFDSENFAMLTGENPNAQAVGEKANAAFNEKAKAWLKENNLKSHKIVGRYGNGENSFLVEGMTRAQAAKFAADLGQESVAHKDGLVLADGSINLFDGGVNDATDYEDFFSAIKDAEGNVRKFGMMPSDTYQDAKGNPISSEEYSSRTDGIASSVDQILEEAIQEAEKPKAKEEVKEETPEASKTSFKPSKDGSYGVRAGVANLSSGEAKSVNNLMKTLRAALGQDVELVIYDDAESSSRELGEGTGGMFASIGNSKTVYLSPEQIKINKDEESVDRKKSFIETLNEEVIHGLVEPSFQKLSGPDQRALLNKIKKEVFDNDPKLLERVKLKRAVYAQNGKGEVEVNGEEFAELLSAIAGDQGVELSRINRARLIFNEILSKALGKFGRQFHIKSTSDFMKIAGALRAARNNPIAITVDQTSAQKSASRSLSPASLRPGENGLTVSFLKPIYKYYGYGEKKDIGSQRVTKTFSDQWHFINWWKKTNNEFSGFETQDGSPIDVERINSYGRKSASLRSGPLGTIDNFRNRVNAAEDQGVLDPVVAKRLMYKVSALDRKMSRQEEGTKAFDTIKNVVDDIDQKSRKMISDIADRKKIDFFFEGDEESSRASQALKLKVREAAEDGIDMKDIDALNSIYGGHFKGQAARNTLLSRFMRDQAMIDVDDFTNINGTVDYDGLFEQASPVFTETLMSTYKSKEARQRIFGEKDPIEFFNNNAKATASDLDLMEADGIFNDRRGDNTVAYNVVKAITSQMNLAKSNMAAASNIFYASAQYRDMGGDMYIDPRIISDIRSGGSSSGVDVSGVNSLASSSVAGNLDKLNQLASDYQRGDGTYNFNKMHKDLGKFTGSEESYVDRSYKAQEMFGPKIGSFALNLNGNEDAITLDSHNLKTLYTFSNMFTEPIEQFDKVRTRVAEEVGMDPYTDSFDQRDEVIHRSNLLKALKAKMMESTDNITEFRRLKRLFDSAVSKKVSSPMPGSPKRTYFEKMILDLASKMDISPAQANQLVFADHQVASHQVKELVPGQPLSQRRYQEFSEFSEEYSRKRSWANKGAARQSALSFVDIESSNAISAMVDESNNPQEPSPLATPEAEFKSSAQLKLGFENSSAEDSPLYRKRSKEEGLTVNPGTIITNKMVDDALATDATSRRILGKGVEMSEGQQVGVRLNLNVMKNTGVPVQTIHDKNATGEALKYGAVVTVKNPVLAVNQNARKKILTFQDNKFPMASVNGEFLSDRIDNARFDGVKAFFNPFKHNVFVDAQGRPIKSAEEATVVGNTVFLRGDIEYYDFQDPVLREGREETAEQRARRIKRGPKYDKALKRYEAYAKRVLGLEFVTPDDLKESYDNMPITSQVAMNESEVAANAEAAEVRASGMLRMRKFAAKASKTYQGARKDIIDNPESYYSKQSLKDLKNSIANMSDQELVDKMTDDALGRLQNRNDDMGVLAASELIRRAAARGDDQAVAQFVEEAAKMGTTAGRILRHFRELKRSTPQGLFSIIQSEIEKRGNTMTTDQAAKLKGITERLFLLQSQHQDLVNLAIQGEDVEADLKSKTDEVKAAERELDIFSNSMIEKGWGELGRQLVQGNLLTTMSQITNVGANLVNAVAKVGVDVIALPAEKLINMFGIESPYKRKYSVGAYLYGMRKFGKGFVEALDEVYTGKSSEVTEWRMSRGFAPYQSLMAVLGKGDLPIREKDGQVSVSQKMKLMVQSTFGVPAEAMFRLLAIGDTPFRRMVEGIELYQAGMAQGLEGDSLKQFIKHPTKAQRDVAEREGRKLTFQERTGTSEAAEQGIRFLQDNVFSHLFDWIPGVDGKAASEFLVRTTVPYVRTPANILIDTMTFVSPYIALPRMMNDLKNGDARGAAQTFGKLAVGTMAAQTARVLIEEGLISGSLEFDDEDEARNLAYDKFPPSSINLSGLERYLAGDDSALQEDDRFIQYNKLGVVGAIMGAIEKSVDKETLANDENKDTSIVSEALTNALGTGAFSSVSYMLDQSFLQGINGLLSTIASSDADDFQMNFERWFGSAFQAASAVALPNQLSAMYRAEREYLPDTRITKDMPFFERLAKKMEYTIKDRTFGLSDVPVRTNWKGEPIQQTPRGANPHAYQLFDITKAKQGSADPVSNEVYRLFEQMEDISRIVGTPSFASSRPVSIPDMSRKLKVASRRLDKEYSFLLDEDFTSGKVRLSVEQMNRMMAAAGKDRYMRASELISSRGYLAMSDEEKLEALNDLNTKYYSKAVSIDRGRLLPHSEELLNIMQEIYNNERGEED